MQCVPADCDCEELGVLAVPAPARACTVNVTFVNSGEMSASRSTVEEPDAGGIGQGEPIADASIWLMNLTTPGHYKVSDEKLPYGRTDAEGKGAAHVWAFDGDNLRVTAQFVRKDDDGRSYTYRAESRDITCDSEDPVEVKLEAKVSTQKSIVAYSTDKLNPFSDVSKEGCGCVVGLGGRFDLVGGLLLLLFPVFFVRANKPRGD